MLKSWDARRDYFVANNHEEAIEFSCDHLIHSAQRAILQRGKFAIALSGGSTPDPIYQRFVEKAELDWSKVWLFFGDERAVPPDHPDSNYAMCMKSFQKVPIPPSQIFRMKAETEIEKHARDYEEKIHHVLEKNLFDLVLLGLGEDGHTASLFPNTLALQINDQLVVANFISEKKCFRMTLTFPCINNSLHSVFHVFGAKKKLIVPQVLNAAIDSPFPASRIGTAQNKALWILDSDSAANLK
jgi:6-phosphogluconolactonase